MRLQLRRILWPTDFSALSLKAIPYVRALSEAFGAELYVLHVIPPLVFTDCAIPVMTAGDKLVTVEDLSVPARQALNLLVKRRFAGIDVAEPKVRVGVPWQEICRYAQRQQIDLIVIATHGHSGLKHLVMGSTSERVVQHAVCPVLAVKSFARKFVTEGADGEAQVPRSAASKLGANGNGSRRRSAPARRPLQLQPT